MRRLSLALFATSWLALACAAPVASHDAESDALPPALQAEVTRLVLPDANEDAWRTLPWIPAYADAVIEAERVDKPLLMWAMNGHPLGCT
ncbi:MAG: hypothetical protein DHS20C15_06320 [Planctomycetota bacterium]|nr:MAG: hypothetical protein DHS20C15_06320 [Planctomycetota bacterium]